MAEQKYVIKKIKAFQLKDIFECGQCFRWNEEENKSYTGIFKNNVINVKEEKEEIIFTGICENDIKAEVDEYFDLKTDYEEMKDKLRNIDSHIKTSIEYAEGIRILNQDLWETIISFIISANNNIPRIKGIIEKMSIEYGKKISWKGKTYYTFPTAEELKNVTVEEFRQLGLGFRDIRIFETTQMVIKKEVDLEEITKKPTKEAKEYLEKLSGVGPKVCDCIILFSTLKRFDVFPIDVWVKRVMNDLYIKNEDESKVDKKEIENLAEEKFGNLKGLAQQYLFYWRRSK